MTFASFCSRIRACGPGRPMVRKHLFDEPDVRSLPRVLVGYGSGSSFRVPVMTHVAFDSQVLSYFLTANSPGYNPDTDPDTELAPQRLAAFRLASWTKIYLLPVVEREVHPIPGEANERSISVGSITAFSKRCCRRSQVRSGCANGQLSWRQSIPERMTVGLSLRLRSWTRSGSWRLMTQK